MLRLRSFLLLGLLSLAACTTSTSPVTIGADGKPLPQVYRVRDRDIAKIQYRVLDSVNSLRAASGAAKTFPRHMKQSWKHCLHGWPKQKHATSS